MSGKVYLTGAGPGDPDLLTLKAYRVISEADVILYDNLVNPAILENTKSDVILIYVGKEDKRHTIPQEEINALLVFYAQHHSTVVRLKGGDPLVFGRGGEEALFLMNSGIDFEFIPGITSAIAAPTYAGIPVTHRGITTSFRVVTGHQATHANNDSDPNTWTLRDNETLIILMGLHRLEKIVYELISNGALPDTPCAIIENATLKNQTCITSTLENILAASTTVSSPTTIVIGKTVLLQSKLQWFGNKTAR